MVRGLALALTVLTGFSALVYQVAWQKYLAALLGSHSEATAAVLGIFLGGLSCGYSLFGRVTEWIVGSAARSGRPPRLLLAYGCVEAGIGVFALAFPLLFGATRSLSLWLPQGVPGLSFAADVLLAVLLIGPPAVLMGGTIPLLTQALARDLEDATRFHSFVYAFNTLGAFAGALCAGFFLIAELGLQATVASMGLVNLAAGALFVLLGGRAARGAAPPAQADPGRLPPGFAALASVALLSGFAMMTLQVAMNRIGAFSLGASNLTFSMVVATFVLCIALGSFAVSALHRIPRFLLPATQWALVAYLLLLYPMVEDAPYWAHRIRANVTAANLGFNHYYLGVFLGILAVFVVPLGLSGATLPLLFHHLRREVGDLGRIAGRLYSWNTVGSLLGALLGGYALLFWLDLHQTYRLAVLALAAGALLSTLRVFGRQRVGALAFAASCLALLALPGWSPKRLSSGLYRNRSAVEHTYAGPEEFFSHFRERWPRDFVVFYSDDPSISVSVNRYLRSDGRTQIGILNNGKNDSSIPVDNPTTAMLGLLPAIFVESPQRAFVIGYGTGMTAGVLAALDSVEEVVVAEISQAVMQAAPLFEPYNGATLQSPKLRVVRSDAYRALLRDPQRYDVIVSAPSNPWITGIELLYTVEFFDAGRERLAPGGVYAQWIQAYDSDEETLALVLRTFRRAFGKMSVWYARGSDLILLGFEDDAAAVDLEGLLRRWERADVRAQFARIGVGSPVELLAHELLPLDVVARAGLPGPLNSIANPILGHRAARAFFFGGRLALLPETHRGPAAAAGTRNSLLRRYAARSGGRLSEGDRWSAIEETCRYRPDQCATLFAAWRRENPDSAALRELSGAAARNRTTASGVSDEVQDLLAFLLGGQPPPGRPASYESVRSAAAAARRHHHHAVPFPEDQLRRLWLGCSADPRCEARLRELDAVASATGGASESSP